jgi:hypothetical protein
METVTRLPAKSWGPRIFLALICLTTLPYGIQCLLDPAAVKEMAGVVAESATGKVELRAAYGGFQIAMSLLAGVAAWRSCLQSSALLAVFVWLGGTVLGRLVGVALEGTMSNYLELALGYELVGTTLSGWFLFKGRDASAGSREEARAQSAA